LCSQSEPQQQSAHETACAAMNDRANPRTTVLNTIPVKGLWHPDREKPEVKEFVILLKSVMTRKLLALLMILSQGAVAFAAPEFMLCFHRDGHVRVEAFELLCCRGEAEEPASRAPACPDEDCRDLPVVESSPSTLPEVGSAFEAPVPSPAFDVPADFGSLFAFPVPFPSRPRSVSGPPPPGPERHLLTVVLRR